VVAWFLAMDGLLVGVGCWLVCFDGWFTCLHCLLVLA
jgi:uncharacterized membrane protein